MSDGGDAADAELMASAEAVKQQQQPPVNDGKEAAGGTANPLEQIERLLTCAICLDRYKQPKLLPCQHTFCLHCLESYVESGGRPRIRCPECRAEHALPLDGGANALQTNLTLLAFLEIHMEASAANAAEMQAYVQRYNLERCRVCEEKATLEVCAHCARKCCAECRKAHLDMLKRDLSRLLGQVRRLSARVKEASEGLGRGLDQLQANGEQTKQEIRDYFNRYQRELKRREEHFLEQADIFVQNEERLMRTLRDALDVEWNNLQDGCLWVDAALNGQRQVRDDELARFKLEFQQGLDYLRSFQPDSEELFAKKLRFSPGDDAAKLPTAIANFGELNVSLPQFANRYLPLEQQYLPRPFRMSLESDNFMARREQQQQQRGNRSEQRFGGGAYRGVGGALLGDEMLTMPTTTTTSPMLLEQQQQQEEGAGAQRWRRRRELEEEAWGRLRAESGHQSPTQQWNVASGGGCTPTIQSRTASRAVSPLCISPLDLAASNVGSGGARSPMSVMPSPNVGLKQVTTRKSSKERAETGGQQTNLAIPPSKEQQQKQQQQMEKAQGAMPAGKGEKPKGGELVKERGNEAEKRETKAKEEEEEEEKGKEATEQATIIASEKPKNPSTVVGGGGSNTSSKTNLRQTTVSSSTAAPQSPAVGGQSSSAVPRPKQTGTAAASAAATAAGTRTTTAAKAKQQSMPTTTTTMGAGSGAAAAATTTGLLPKNGQAEGPARGRLLMVNGPLRSTTTAGGVPRRTPPISVPISNSTSNIYHQQQQQQLHNNNSQQQQQLVLIGGTSRLLHPKAQKPPLPARRQHSVGDDQAAKATTTTAAAALLRQMMMPTTTTSSNGEKKKQQLVNGSAEEGGEKEEEEDEEKPCGNAEEEEEEKEEEEDEVVGNAKCQNTPTVPIAASGGGGDGGKEQRGRNTMRIQSQSKQFRIHCRSSSHGRRGTATDRRPSIETGQPIPVAFFPIKTTGEWTDVQRHHHQGGGLMLSRSRTNPNLGSAVNLMVQAAKTTAAAVVVVDQSLALARMEPVANRIGIVNGNDGGVQEGTTTTTTRKRISLEEDKEALAKKTTKTTIGDKPEAEMEEEENQAEKTTTTTMLEWGKRYERIRNRPRLVLSSQLNWPRGVCPVVLPPSQTDQSVVDLFACADSSNHRVQLFSAQDGTLRHSFGTFGSGDGQFDGCSAVCVHQSRAELLVADRYNHRVQIFDLHGCFVRKFGCAGTGSGQFQHCWGIAVDEQLGLVYVADKDNHRVQMFDAEGAYLTKFGTMGDGARQFNHPLYLAFHQQNRLLYVADSANNRISVFSADGLPVRQFQGDGPPDSHLKLPRGIAIDQRGFLLVADSGNNRIQVFSPLGQCLRQFGTWGSAPGQFKGVEGICLVRGGDGGTGGAGHLVIADRENNRLQLFDC